MEVYSKGRDLLEPLKPKAKLIILLLILITAIFTYIVPVMAMMNIGEKKFEAPTPLEIKGNFSEITSTEIPFAIEKINITFNMPPIGYKAVFGGLVVIEMKGNINETNKGNSHLYINFTITCNDHPILRIIVGCPIPYGDEKTFLWIGLTEGISLPPGPRGINVVKDFHCNFLQIIDGKALKTRENILLLEVSISANIFEGKLPELSYYKVEVEEFWCKIIPLPYIFYYKLLAIEKFVLFLIINTIVIAILLVAKYRLKKKQKQLSNKDYQTQT